MYKLACACMYTIQAYYSCITVVEQATYAYHIHDVSMKHTYTHYTYIHTHKYMHTYMHTYAEENIMDEKLTQSQSC
jgi:hypothetical protein